MLRWGKFATPAALGPDRLQPDFRSAGVCSNGSGWPMNKAESKEQAIRKLQPGKLVIASHNAGKVREIRKLLGPFGIKPVSAAELGLPEPEETGTSFIANAELKALQAADLSGLPALADDSGLCVEARSEEHTSELQSLMRISYAVFCLKKKKPHHQKPPLQTQTE